MNNLALITGASGGIGLALAKQHAQAGGDLLLVARSADKLDAIQTEISEQYGVQVWSLSIDLSQTDAPQQVWQFTQDHQLTVDILINNAGLGDHHLFAEESIEKIEQMLHLNVRALTLLTRLFLPEMQQRQSGKILNIASIAAFFPGPWMSVYYATKAYVKSFSLGIAKECETFGVSVSVYCPGPIKSGFVSAGDLENVKAWDKAPTAAQAAEVGYVGLQKGDLIIFNDWKLRLLAQVLLPFIPTRLALRLSQNSIQKSS